MNKLKQTSLTYTDFYCIIVKTSSNLDVYCLGQLASGEWMRCLLLVTHFCIWKCKKVKLAKNSPCTQTAILRNKVPPLRLMWRNCEIKSKD